MHRVFISYSTADHEVAMRLAEVVRGAGFEPWVYERSGTAFCNYLSEVHAAIYVSEAVALLISNDALRSNQVANEVVLAHEFGKPFLPILIEMSHVEFQKRKPDWRLALGATVSLRIPPGGIELVAPRIIQGLHALVKEQLANQAEIRGAPTNLRIANHVDSSTSAHNDPWADLRSRIQSFPKEILHLRNVLNARWNAVVEQGCVRRDLRSLAVERVRIADLLLCDLIDVVDQEWAAQPQQWALIARGGYGRGVLSLGSDVDVTYLHGSDCAKEAEAFFPPFARGLGDICNAVSGLKSAPIVSTVSSCVSDWTKVIRQEQNASFSTLVSFAFTRHLAGQEALHAELAEAWRGFVRGMTHHEVKLIANRLRSRVNNNPVSSELVRFDIKLDAGGILDFRLIGFIEQVLAIRGAQAEVGDLGLSHAHSFLLWLRDNLYVNSRTHILVRRNLDKLTRIWREVHAPEIVADDLAIVIGRHRRRVRSGLLRAVELLERLE